MIHSLGIQIDPYEGSSNISIISNTYKISSRINPHYLWLCYKMGVTY